MNPERWKEVRAVFDAAVGLAPDARAEFVDAACASDADLRAEVVRLLASSDRAGGFMEDAAAAEVADLILGPAVAPGTRFGHYEIVRQIGAGGMGEVYLATDQKLGRSVAVKVLNERFAAREADLERFLDEARSASALNHPNILVIHELGETGGARFIVSEFVDGRTLRESLTEARPTLPVTLDVAIQVAGALAAAHAAGIVHRDIKPENVMIRPDGYVKVLDFGLAKLVERPGDDDAAASGNRTAEGLILGTVNYMSPEQAKAVRVDERTDIFSLGAMLFEMIAGRTPFAGASTAETIAALVSAEAPPLARFAPDAPPELARIVAAALRHRREERYAAMDGMLADLKSLRENITFGERLAAPTAASADDDEGERPVAVAEAATADARRRIGIAVAMAAGAAALTIAAALAAGYRFTTPEKAPAADSAATARTAPNRSVAVLPFANAGGDPGAEYLSDGISESVINNLSQLSGLKVMSRNSAFRFKNDQSDLRSIASRLGVETVVTGDVRQLGDKYVINVRLIDPADESQIWGSQYVRTTGDILAVQNEIAQAVAQNLRVRLTRSDQAQLRKSYTESAEANQLFLKGRYHLLNFTLPEIEKGVGYFKQAIALDPNFALAYSGLAEGYRMAVLSADRPPNEYFPQAREAAIRAVELDDTLSEAHRNLGAVEFFYDWDWKGAEAQYLRALELDPNNASAHWAYAILLSNNRRHDEALAEIRLARQLDPLNMAIIMAEGVCLNAAGKPDETLAEMDKALELNPNFWPAFNIRSSAYIRKGMFDAAIAEARRAKTFNPDNIIFDSNIGIALAGAGRTAEARAVVKGMLKAADDHFVPPSSIAAVYAALGETDRALTLIERAVEIRDVDCVFFKVSPTWDTLRAEPRFVAVMRRMNLE